MTASDVVRRFADQECWTTDTLVVLLCQFIDRLRLVERLREFLADMVRGEGS
jgi:hypothetical protein